MTSKQIIEIIENAIDNDNSKIIDHFMTYPSAIPDTMTEVFNQLLEENNIKLLYKLTKHGSKLMNNLYHEHVTILEYFVIKNLKYYGEFKERCDIKRIREKLGNPTVISTNGYQQWLCDGKLHRENDKPAVIWTDGRQEWYINGKRHREDEGCAPECGNSFGVSSSKPAIIYADGRQEWWIDGTLIKTE